MLAHSKSSLAPHGASLGYRLDDGRFEWQAGGLLDVSVEQLLQRPGDAEEKGVLAEAMVFLRDLLADGPVPTKEVFAEGKGVGFSEITLRRAKTRLGAKADREHHQKGGRGKGQWVWLLQDDQEGQ